MRRLVRWALLLVTAGILAACGDDDNQTLIRQRVLFGTTLGSTLLGPSDLVVLNPNTGAYIRTVGSTGYNVNGLAYDQTTGKLYATTTASDPVFPSGLIEINTTTGAGTPIGTGHGLAATAVSLTVDSTGQLYAWQEPGVDSLVTIDKVTGLGALVGDSGLSTSELGLAFDGNDILWLVDSGGDAYTINTLTGAPTLIGTLPVARAHHGTFHPATGLYWGIDETDDSAAGAPTRNLYVIDMGTGTLVDTLPTVDYLHTIAFSSKWVLVSM